MRNVWSSLLLLLLLCVSAGVGFFVNSRLPERRRSREAIELVQLANTLLVTFTAIVLGLLTTSVKAGLDAAYNARGDYAAQLAQMDRRLRDYGPETAPIREKLRSYVAAVIGQHLALGAASCQRQLSQHVEDDADRGKLGAGHADERYRPRTSLRPAGW